MITKDDITPIDEDGITLRWERVAPSSMSAAGGCGGRRGAGRWPWGAQGGLQDDRPRALDDQRGEDDLDEGPLPEGRAPQGRRREAATRRNRRSTTTRRLAEPATLGPPMQPLRWVSKSGEKLARALGEMGHKISANTVGRLLTDVRASRRVNRKADEGWHHPDRNAQFEHINAKVVAAQARVSPSSRWIPRRRSWSATSRRGSDDRPQGQPARVNVHVLPDKGWARRCRRRLYDVAADEAFVSVGITADTVESAVAAIRTWIERMGGERYPKMSERRSRPTAAARTVRACAGKVEPQSSPTRRASIST